MVGNAYFRVPAMLARIFPDGLNFTVEELILEGERAAAAVRSEGRFDGDSLYSNDYAFFFNFVGAQISSVAEHFNPLRVSPALSERMRVALAD
ncbi:ketosteroid isomerase-like protein [Sphingobium sp. OAS761]|nr:ketosteroid isomerase-like protein [Sphingobium sp. OAS761]